MPAHARPGHYAHHRPAAVKEGGTRIPNQRDPIHLHSIVASIQYSTGVPYPAAPHACPVRTLFAEVFVRVRETQRAPTLSKI